MSEFEKAQQRAAAIVAKPWVKEPAVEGSVACLTCGCGGVEHLDDGRIIAVGFGSAFLTKSGGLVWSEDDLPRDDDGLPPEDCPQPLTMGDAERLATEDPDADWRVSFHAPLYDAVYQRQDAGKWVLVESGEGFA